MKRKELENMARETLTIAAWAIHRLPVVTWPDWPVLLVDLIAAQNDAVDEIENALVELHYRLEERLARGQW